MRAVIYTGGGGPEVISSARCRSPRSGPGHIRVRVHAAGLNRADLIQRRGHYAAPPGWPAESPGWSTPVRSRRSARASAGRLATG